MKEIRDIIQAFDKAQNEGRQTALATVVHVEGSSYRRPGARMLITDEGQLTGAISGGCLEGDALRKAQLVMAQKRAMLVTYDTMDEDDAKFGVGLGCNGIIQVLIEPIDNSDEANPIVFLKKLETERKHAVLVTLFSLQNRRDEQPGTCLLIRDQHAIGTTPLPIQIIMDDAKEVLERKQSSFKNYIRPESSFTAFIELILPPVSLVIAGAGNDAIPLAEMASILGWEITVVDGRSTYAKADRFPQAKNIVISKPTQVLEQVHIDEQTVFVLMSHNYNYDKELLQYVLAQNVTYAGMLGPHKKLQRILTEWNEEGIIFSADQLSTIHSPVGLNIGAETPEEIAVSIIAEIKAVLAGKHGLSLKRNTEVIHPRSLTTVEEKRLS